MDRLIRAFMFAALAAGLMTTLSGCADDDDDSSSDDALVDDDDGNDDLDDDIDDDSIDPDDAKFDEVIAFMEDEFAANGVTGGAVAIVRGGQMKYAAGVGDRDRESGLPVDEDTLFVLGSITKMVTAAGVMTLVDDGLVDLAAPVTATVPYFDLLDPFDPSSITPHMLLTHTSGLPDYLEIECDTDDGALARWFTDNPDVPLWSPPGLIHNYANLGYSLAGLVLEEGAGMPYMDALRERVLEPLGMDGVTNDGTAAKAGNHATGYSVDGGTYDIDAYPCALGWPPGLMIGRVVDMARFMEMLLAGGAGVLSAESAAALQAPQVETRFAPDEWYGYGIESFEYKTMPVKWHNGGIMGYLTDLWLVPGEDFGVVVFVNDDGYDPANVSLFAIDTFLEPPDVDPPDYTTPPETWDRYVGEYFDPWSIGTILVRQEGDLTLWMDLPDVLLSSQLVQIAADTFYIEVEGTLLPVTFWINDEGVSQYVVTRAGVGERVDEDAKAAAGRRAGPDAGRGKPDARAFRESVARAGRGAARATIEGIRSLR